MQETTKKTITIKDESISTISFLTECCSLLGTKYERIIFGNPNYSYLNGIQIDKMNAFGMKYRLARLTHSGEIGNSVYYEDLNVGIEMAIVQEQDYMKRKTNFVNRLPESMQKELNDSIKSMTWFAIHIE